MEPVELLELPEPLEPSKKLMKWKEKKLNQKETELMEPVELLELPEPLEP